jgi:hypothetical protein
MRSADRPAPAGVGGWLLLLILLLVVWGPLQYAIVAASALGSLPVRGLSLGLVLVWRLVVTAFGVASGLALYSRRGPAVTMTKASLLLAAATDTFVYLTPYFPSTLYPGEAPYYVAASLGYWTVWLVYLSRSSRVRRTYDS